ncbi:MAG: arylsulfatase A-like enzyme [Planctomycetota bacterium]|jgi:arylsulfatase A-like enzyme
MPHPYPVLRTDAASGPSSFRDPFYDLRDTPREMVPRPSPIRRVGGGARRIGVCALFALTALGACSDPPEPHGGGRYDKPAFTRIGTGERSKPDVAMKLVAPRGLSPWEVTGVTAKVNRGPDGEDRLLLLGKADRSVKIPGEYDPQAFNQVLVRGIFPGVVGVKVLLLGPGEQKYLSDTLSSNNSPSEQQILFDLPRLRLKQRAFETLELRIIGTKPRQIEIKSIDLINLPLHESLPDPVKERALISVDHEARQGFGLTKSEAIRTEFTVADSEESLYFSHGQPSKMAMKKFEPEINVRIFEGEIELFRDQYTVRSDGWKDVTIRLSEWVGKTLSCELRVDGEFHGDEIIAVANFRVSRPAIAPRTVLLVSSDTHRGDHLGFMGDLVNTPNIDALGARGVMFEDAYAATNITSPSHVSMMTGRHPRDHRIVSNTGHMIDEAGTLASAFAAEGFACIGLVSVRHLGPDGTGLGQGFDRMRAPLQGTWNATQVVDATLKMMDIYEGQPLFIWLHMFEAHHPYNPPAEFDRRYYEKDKDPFDESLPELIIAKNSIPKDMVGLRDLEFPKAQYRAEVDYLDQELGRLFALPRIAAGITALTSDHGEILENQGTYFNHTEIYPAALHVPLVMAWPDAPAGTRVKEPVQMLNVGRSLLDLAGLGGSEFPGRNVLGLLEGESSGDVARFALAAHGAAASITKDGWHLMLHLRDHKGALPVERKEREVELYDMNTDPKCHNNLNNDPLAKSKGRELCALLSAWLNEKKGDSLSTSGTKSAADMDALASLGYAPDKEVVEDEPWLNKAPDYEPCGCFE